MIGGDDGANSVLGLRGRSAQATRPHAQTPLKFSCRKFTCKHQYDRNHPLFTADVGSIPVFEPRCEKTGPREFRPGPTQTGLYSHRRWLEA